MFAPAYVGRKRWAKPQPLWLSRRKAVEKQIVFLPRTPGRTWGTRVVLLPVQRRVEGETLTLQLIRDLDQRIGRLHLALNIP
jgi:hypothetical protein